MRTFGSQIAASAKPQGLGILLFLVLASCNFGGGMLQMKPKIEIAVNGDGSVTEESAELGVTPENASNVVIGGSCSTAIQRIEVIGPAGQQETTCDPATKTWQIEFDLSQTADGVYQFVIRGYSVGGSQSETTLKVAKDTVAPQAGIVIDTDAAFTRQAAVTLALTTTDAKDMYVTNTAGCASGGSWESVASTKAWTLPQIEATNTVYLKTRDAHGNESACVSDSILYSLDPCLGTALTGTFAGGSGTFADPYQVCTTTQFGNIGTNNNKHYLLLKDLDFANATVPTVNLMNGASFNGNGKTIRNYRSNRGLFYIVSNAALSNLTVEGYAIDGGGTESSSGAMAAATGIAVLYNLHARNGSVANSTLYMGGLVGSSCNSTMSRSSATFW